MADFQRDDEPVAVFRPAPGFHLQTLFDHLPAPGIGKSEEIAAAFALGALNRGRPAGGARHE